MDFSLETFVERYAAITLLFLAIAMIFRWGVLKFFSEQTDHSSPDKMNSKPSRPLDELISQN